MKNLIIAFAAALTLVSCGPKENPTQVKIENLIKNYCTANNEKQAKKVTQYLYPEIFNYVEQEQVEQFYYMQANNTEKLLIDNIQFEEAPELIDDSKEIKVYAQKYTSSTTIGLSKEKAAEGFSTIEQIAKKADSNAKIDAENHEVTFTDKKKLIAVESADGNFYILPNMFLSNDMGNKMDIKKVKEAVGMSTP